MSYLFISLFFLSSSFTASIAQELNCEYFEGEWKGNKKGKDVVSIEHLRELNYSFFKETHFKS